MPAKSRKLASPSDDHAQFLLGREEWVALPGLQIPALRAKIDTGAATSALHAVGIEGLDRDGVPHVRFVVHPIPGRQDVAISCIAPTLGRRWVTSSNGERELRHVIETAIRVGERTWPIAVTLSNRVGLRNRMLIGRQALQDDMVVLPRTTFQQSELDYTPYSASEVRSSPLLDVAVLTASPSTDAWRPLCDALANRGHRIVRIDTRACRIEFQNGTAVESLDGKRIDAPGIILAGVLDEHGMAVLRHLERRENAYALTSSEAFGQASDRRRCVQQLWQHGLATTTTAITADGPCDIETPSGDRVVIECLVFAGRVHAAIKETRGQWRIAKSTIAQRRLAVSAARALGLRLCAVAIDTTGSEPRIALVETRPQLTAYRDAGAGDAIVTLAAYIERLAGQAGAGSATP